MANKENKDTVLRFWQEVFNERKLEQIDKIFTQTTSITGLPARMSAAGKA